MFSTTFDLVLAMILTVLAVVFWMGKGEAVMELFHSRHQTQKKRSKEEERAYQKAIAFFLIPLAISEWASVFIPSPIMGLVLALVAVVDLIVFAKYTKGK